MKVNLLAAFDREKYNLTTNVMFTKENNYNTNFYKQPSKSIHRCS